jgi:hypothetical protein
MRADQTWIWEPKMRIAVATIYRPSMTTILRERLAVSLPALLVLQLCSMLTFDYYRRVEAPAWKRRVEVHASLIHGTAPYEKRYRVLIPYLAEGLARTLETIPTFRGSVSAAPMPYSTRAFNAAYVLLNFSALLLLLTCLRRLLEAWFEPPFVLFGLVLAAAMIEFTFRDHFFHPWSFWEAAFYALGMRFLLRGRWGAIILLSGVAASCRETTAFLPLGFLLFAVGLDFRRWARIDLKRRDVQAAIGSLALWLGVWVAVHRFVGYAPPTVSLETLLVGNLARLPYSILVNMLLLGVPLILAATALGRSPRLVRAMTVAFVPHVAVLLTLGYWWEIRYWMTVLPVLIPAALSAIQPPRASSPDMGSGPFGVHACC